MNRTRVMSVLFGVALAGSMFVEVSAAQTGSSPFLNSSIEMSAPTFVAMLMTPTAKLAEAASYVLDKKVKGKKPDDGA